MARFDWSRSLKRHAGTGSQSRRNGARVNRTRFLPRLDPMEARTLLSTLLVSNLGDSGAGSLRAAIATPGNGNIIDFAQGLHGTITLASDLPITHSVTINGPGANRVSVSGNDANQVFAISGNASVSIGGLTITDGQASSGGGILLEDSAALSLSNCKLTDNVAQGGSAGAGVGGGIEDSSSGALVVTNCSFDANEAIATGPTAFPGFPATPPASFSHLAVPSTFLWRAPARPRSVTVRSPGTRPWAAAPAPVREEVRSAMLPILVRA
jgi:hypothetical protein